MTAVHRELRESLPGRLFFFFFAAIALLGARYLHKGGLSALLLATAVGCVATVAVLAVLHARSIGTGTASKRGLGAVAALSVGLGTVAAGSLPATRPWVLGFVAGVCIGFAAAAPPSFFRKWSDIRTRRQ